MELLSGTLIDFGDGRCQLEQVSQRRMTAAKDNALPMPVASGAPAIRHSGFRSGRIIPAAPRFTASGAAIAAVFYAWRYTQAAGNSMRTTAEYGGVSPASKSMPRTWGGH